MKALKRETIIREDLIDNRFIAEVNKFKSFLTDLKFRLDQFDSKNSSHEQTEKMLDERKKQNFGTIKRFFDQVWDIVKNLDKNDYAIYQAYFQKNILPLVGNAEVNKHIYIKPLGYSGDFITMNYIFDYHDKFIGKTSFEKLINNLTCSIPISLSNIARKEFLKGQILRVLTEKGANAKIASIASGSAREVLELLNDNSINVPVKYIFFDFENKALEYIKNGLNKVDQRAKVNFDASFINDNVINIIRKPAIREKLQGQDLIYAFGIYDYLSDIVAKKLTSALFGCLKSGGTLVVCNASVDKTDFRAYFEFLGEWNMIYRTKEEMMGWTDKFPSKQVAIRDNPDEAYLYLIIKK